MKLKYYLILVFVLVYSSNLNAQTGSIYSTADITSIFNDQKASFVIN